MKDETRDELGELLSKVEESEETAEVTIRDYNPSEELTKTLYGFVEKQLQAVQKQETFRSVVVEALIDKIKDQEVSVPDLLRAYEVISKQSRESGAAIMNLFKQDGNGKGGGLLGGESPGESDESDYESLSTKERVAIDRLSRILSSSDLAE